MTGFGRGEAGADATRVTVEIRTVNHRFFTSTVKLPRDYAALEQRLAARVKERVERGHASVSVELTQDGAGEGRGESTYALNRDVLRGYLAALDEIRDLARLEGAVDLTQILALPGIFERGARQPLPEETFLPLASLALNAALEDLIRLREQEGSRLEADLVNRLGELEAAVERIARLAPEREIRERVRLSAKVRDLLAGAEAGLESRIVQEVALLADRLDVAEEITRFRSHVALFRETLAADAPAGRQLNFILQEMLREVNTMGSKANDSRIAQEVIGMKNELEKLREQVENIE